EPTVLTVHPRAHPQTSVGRAPEGVRVEHAFALDAARHLSVLGRYPGWLAVPDRWISWFPDAVMKGLRVVRQTRPDLIWSTFPIATAHLVALALHKLTRTPWIADFRDPMTETDPKTGIQYPVDATVRSAYARIESLAVRHCARAVFTTRG